MTHPDELEYVPKKGYGYVYHIICNNKHYIGISTTPFSRRWMRHTLPSSGCIRLKTELRRAKEAGKWHTIKALILKEDKNSALDSLLKKFIKKFGSYRSFNGLNSTPGGRDMTPDKLRKLFKKNRVKKTFKKSYKKNKRLFTSPLV